MLDTLIKNTLMLFAGELAKQLDTCDHKDFTAIQTKVYKLRALADEF